MRRGADRRAAILTGGRSVRLPDHRDGWRWEPYAVDGADVEAARQQLQRLMRDAEADIAEALSSEGWLTTHHRRMLTRPELTAGERSGLFAMGDAFYGCYLRVGDPGPWAGPRRRGRGGRNGRLAGCRASRRLCTGPRGRRTTAACSPGRS